jgi:L,D-transpeptidase catalytic domain
MRQAKDYRFCIARATAALSAITCVCFLAIALAPARAHASLADAGELEPGEYQWDPSLAPSGPMTMVVNLHTQRAYVYRDGVQIGVTTISTGKPGYRTPTGTFTVLEKERHHRSNKYDDAPMPYMQRLSWSGLALHAGAVRAWPASHGCVRLPYGFAAALYKEATRGMKVVITNQKPDEEDILASSTENTPTNSQCCETNDSQ